MALNRALYSDVVKALPICPHLICLWLQILISAGKTYWS